MDVFGSAPQRVMSVVAGYQTNIALTDQDVIFKVTHNCLRDHQCISGPNGSFNHHKRSKCHLCACQVSPVLCQRVCCLIQLSIYSKCIQPTFSTDASILNTRSLTFVCKVNAANQLYRREKFCWLSFFLMLFIPTHTQLCARFYILFK